MKKFERIDLSTLNWHSVLIGFGVDARFLDSKRKGPCPVCAAQTGEAGNTRFMFINKTGKGDWYCHAGNGGSGHGGDGINILMESFGWTFYEALDALRDKYGSINAIEYKAPSKPSPSKNIDEKNRDKLKKVWEQSTVIKVGDPGHKYLLRRVPKLFEMPSSSIVRVHSGLDYWEIKKGDDGKDIYKKLGKFPALISLVKVAGHPVSIHRTFITKEGEKAPVPDSKKSMSGIGSMAGSYIELYPLGKSTELAVSEGVEKSLAIHSAYKGKFPVWSCVSADILKNFTPPKQVTVLHIFKDYGEKGEFCAGELKRRMEVKGIQVVMHETGDINQDYDDVWKNIVNSQQQQKAAA